MKTLQRVSRARSSPVSRAGIDKMKRFASIATMRAPFFAAFVFAVSFSAVADDGFAGFRLPSSAKVRVGDFDRPKRRGSPADPIGNFFDRGV